MPLTLTPKTEEDLAVIAKPRGLPPEEALAQARAEFSMMPSPMCGPAWRTSPPGEASRWKNTVLKRWNAADGEIPIPMLRRRLETYLP